MKIVAIIQARMGSTRLPRKILMEIGKKPMLWHVVERTRQSKNVDEVILAIPDTKENNALEDFAIKNNIKCYRGSEENVLSRYYEAAKKFKADVIVRITSDCPLIDPTIIDEVVAKHIKTQADFTANLREGKGEKRTFPRGLDVEVFSFSALEKSNFKAQNNFQREHVDSYIFENQDEFKIEAIDSEEDFSSLRWTVDEVKDLEFVREVYKKLYKEGKVFLMEDIISLLKKYPELAEVNSSVKQKHI